MHELSLCRSIATIVRRAANGRKVATIHVDCGDLRQVVPGTLTHCWGLVSAEGDLAGSRLLVNRIPAVLHCRECQARTQLDDLPILKCAACGSSAIDVVSGEEFAVAAIDVEV
jgi:hydrogenase nickel incorporation protein HypA/HybF